MVRNRAPLRANAFDPLPLGAIEPRGWLLDQLKIQAKGLTGHLGEFWPDLSEGTQLKQKSAWLGGEGEAWERGPYYADGLLPLAYELRDPELMRRANAWVEWTLTHQQVDGEIGPTTNHDWWPRMVMLKVLTQYAEATGDARVEPLMSRYFEYELRELPRRPLESWGRYRWQDNALTVLWLYNRTGNARLLALAGLLRQQGFNWQDSFKQFPFTTRQTRRSLGLDDDMHNNTDRAMQAHGVNNAMALKASPVSYMLTGAEADRAGLYRQIGELERYHLLPNGLYSGDEHFAGDDPSQGVELCTVVESMFSWELNLGILGDARFADRLERIAFNALPGTISDDMWSHQYDQQPNQVACTQTERQWSTNGPDSNLFGLEPNFGCCTANMHQGWPKFAASLWMATADGGLVATAYAPSRVTVELPGSGAPARRMFSVEETTNYPFDGRLVFTVHTARPTSLPLVLRVPDWASGASLTINGTPSELPGACTRQASYDGRLHVDTQSVAAGCGFRRIARRWKEGDRVELTLTMVPRVTRWYHGSVAVERGPLLFSLKLPQTWKKLAQHAELSADWQLTSEAPWNYALAVNGPDAIAVKTDFVGPVPFSAEQAPVQMTVYGRLDPSWGLHEGSAGPLPQSPVSLSTPLVPLTLIPYAAAKLRVTAFPELSAGSDGTAAKGRGRE